jgi:pimeloyl-ACP methyl ester carboxylesterase
MIVGAVAVFFITLGLGQVASTALRFRGASLVGASRWAGFSLGIGLIILGAILLPQNFLVLLWVPPMGIITMVLLLLAGSLILPPPHPNSFFVPDAPDHGGCCSVQIPDGDGYVPGLLLFPRCATVEEKETSSASSVAAKIETGTAVCIVHGAGDTKISFKWRLIEKLIAEGFTVLTIDLPGHGDNRDRPLVYPDSLSAVPAALRFLRAQRGVKRVGLIGVSLGGAMAIRALADHGSPASLIDALVILATPVELKYTNTLFYREMWNTCYQAPLVSLLREITVKQLRESWYSGGYRSRHNTSELFQLLRPLDYIRQLKAIPILLVYSRADLVAPPDQARSMRQAAPHADFIEAKKASHVALILMPEIIDQISKWFGSKL